jgi:hypothetical protein
MPLSEGRRAGGQRGWVIQTMTCSCLAGSIYNILGIVQYYILQIHDQNFSMIKRERREFLQVLKSECCI